MKSNTITINLNYNEEDVQLDINDLIISISHLLKEKYKGNNLAYEVKDTSITTISVPSPQYPVNPGPYIPVNPSPDIPWYDPSPFRYDKIGDQPAWWKHQPTCVVNPNNQQYTTPINMNVNNKKGNN